MNRIVNIEGMRSHFPALGQQVHGKDLVYFDNGATAQKPQSVISLINEMNSGTNGNIHRAVHELSARCTSLYESARLSIKDFINSPSSEEIIFTSGTTASINLVAFSFTQRFINKGDSVIICEADHHSNIVPWQMACERSGAELKILPVDENGEWNLEQLDSILDEKVKIVSVAHISNVLGIENPVSILIEKAHRAGARVMLDGAQGIVHGDVDVQQLDCDFYAFSGHKLYGPTGTGVLYGKREILEEISPWMGGGDMVDTVSLYKTTYAPIPLKFEAGTPNVGGNIALGAAIDFIENIGQEHLQNHENALLDYAQKQLLQIEGLKIYGEKAHRTGVVSFNLEGIGISSDVGMILDKLGIAVRTGHHCTQPIMNFFDIAGTVRASFAIYNTFEEIDVLAEGVKKAQRMLG